jgi:hypothetical protein
MVALVLFAAPLWYAWQVTIQDGRAEICKPMRSVSPILSPRRRRGPEELHRCARRMQIAGDRILLLTDASMHPLAGNLPLAAPPCRRRPGNYTIKSTWATHGDQTALVHVALLGNYNLLVGGTTSCSRRWNAILVRPGRRHRRAVDRRSLIGLITRRALMSRVNSIRQTVSAIIHGDLKHRLPTH